MALPFGTCRTLEALESNPKREKRKRTKTTQHRGPRTPLKQDKHRPQRTQTDTESYTSIRRSATILNTGHKTSSNGIRNVTPSICCTCARKEAKLESEGISVIHTHTHTIYIPPFSTKKMLLHVEQEISKTYRPPFTVLHSTLQRRRGRVTCSRQSSLVSLCGSTK